MNPVIGIIGGMGPLATCDLMNKIIRFTDAQKDQDHIRICVVSNTNIPDGTITAKHRCRSWSRAHFVWRQWERSC